MKPSAPDTVLSSESHSFSRVFTGAFYDCLVRLCADGIRRGDEDASIERARRLAGRLLARAVETLPPGEARFKSLALRMREIDQEEEGGVGSIAIEGAFAAHGIKLPSLPGRARRGRGTARSRRRGTGGQPGSSRSGYRLLRALDPDRPGGMAALRAALGLPVGCRLVRTTLRRHVGGGIREQLTHLVPVSVRHASLGGLSGVVVLRWCGCTLTRDPSGDIEGVALNPLREPPAAALARQIRAWVARGAIVTDRDSRLPSREHFRRGAPFRVTKAGVLERVYFD